MTQERKAIFMSNYTTRHVTFLSHNKINRISGVIYIPEGTPKAILQISHGMCEYIGRYDSFMGYMAQQGFIVAGNDHLGHGDSSEEADYGFFGEKDGYIHFIEDLHQMTVIVKQEYGDLPCFLLGHSMGSFIARLYLSKYGSELDGAIICGTGGPNPMAGIGIRLAGRTCRKKGPRFRSKVLDKMAFGSFNKKCKPCRTSKDWLTRDTAIVDQYLNDPKCMFLFTAAGFRDLLTLSSRANSKQWYESLSTDLPILLIAGDSDPVGNYGKGVKKVFRNLQKQGVRDVSMILYPEGRHEILNEINRQQVFENTENWIKKHLQLS